MRTAFNFWLSAIWGKWVSVVLLSVLWLAGCQAEITEPAPAATVTSLPAPATAPVVVAPTATRPVASLTLTSAPTLARSPTLLPTTPALSPTATACSYQAQFIQDVTIPDDTPVEAGQSVVKTWRLRNTGTCLWTADVALVFVAGTQMGTTTEVPLPGPVAPGEMVDLTVSLVAPAVPGRYQGDWKLRAPSGTLFGVGAIGQAPIWVRIVVVEPTPAAAVPQPPAPAPTAAATATRAEVPSPTPGPGGQPTLPAITQTPVSTPTAGLIMTPTAATTSTARVRLPVFALSRQHGATNLRAAFRFGRSLIDRNTAKVTRRAGFLACQQPGKATPRAVFYLNAIDQAMIWTEKGSDD